MKMQLVLANLLMCSALVGSEGGVTGNKKPVLSNIDPMGGNDVDMNTTGSNPQMKKTITPSLDSGMTKPIESDIPRSENVPTIKLDGKPKGIKPPNASQFPEPIQSMNKADMMPQPAQGMNKVDEMPQPAQDMNKVDMMPQPAQGMNKVDEMPQPAQGMNKADMMPQPAQGMNKVDEMPQPAQDMNKVDMMPQPIPNTNPGMTPGESMVDEMPQPAQDMNKFENMNKPQEMVSPFDPMAKPNDLLKTKESPMLQGPADLEMLKTDNSQNLTGTVPLEPMREELSDRELEKELEALEKKTSPASEPNSTLPVQQSSANGKTNEAIDARYGYVDQK